MNQLIQDFLWHYSYPNIYLLTVLYFLILYFILGWVFEASCKLLQSFSITELIIPKEQPAGQTRQEIKYSLVSIFVFGFSSIPVVYLYRAGIFTEALNSTSNVLWNLLALNIWNEIHFFLIHRLMHIPFFLKHIHKIHHRSKIPSVWSVFSFHWLEALLLSTVPLTLCFIMHLSPLAIAIYPLNSILFNFSGHCNYRFKKLQFTFLNMATRHVDHHQKTKVSFGFVTNILDALFTKTK